MPLLRVLYAHVAACCNNFATTLHFREGLKRVRLRRCITHPLSHQPRARRPHLPTLFGGRCAPEHSLADSIPVAVSCGAHPILTAFHHIDR